ncbi:GNAT family N-acetyltransferase [Arthrobacter sp. Z1-15]
MTVSVSPARPEDAAELAALAALTFPLACPPAVTPEDSAAFVAANLSKEAFEAYLADPSIRVLVIREGGHIRGYALLVFLPPADPEVVAALQTVPGPTAELSKCYVHPAAHGSGLATALMEAARETAAAEGFRSLWLGVNDLNVRAQAFYRKSGFTKVGRRSFDVGPHTFRDFILAAPLARTTGRE